MVLKPVSMLNHVGRAVAGAAALAFVVPWTPPSLPSRSCSKSRGGRPARAGRRGRAWGSGRVAARHVVEGRPRAGRQPHVEGTDEDAVGVVGVNRDGLVVPVLRVVAAPGRAHARARVGAGGEQRARRAGHVAPGGAAVGRGPDAELAAGGVAAAAVVVGGDGLHLRVDVVRVARRDGDVDAAELVPASSCRRRACRCPRSCWPWSRTCWSHRAVDEAVGVARDGSEGRAAARGHVGLVEAVGAVLVEVVLDGGGEAADAERRDDAGGAAAMLVSSRPVMSCRCVLKLLVVQGQSSSRRRRRRGRGRSSCRPRPCCCRWGQRAPCRPPDTAGTGRAGTGSAAPKTSAPSTVQVAPGVGRFQDALTAHREGAVVEVAGAGVDRVVIVRVDDDGVDAGGRDRRVVGDGAPGGRAATAVRGLPDAAADARGVGDDGRGDRVDRDGVDAAGGRRVVEAAGAAGHRAPAEGRAR